MFEDVFSSRTRTHAATSGRSSGSKPLYGEEDVIRARSSRISSGAPRWFVIADRSDA
jgi:hypothetical protein